MAANFLALAAGDSCGRIVFMNSKSSWMGVAG
jgi:hypothetical protein